MTSSTVSDLWKRTLPGDDKSCRMRQCRESPEPARRRCGRRTRRSAPFETPARMVACRCDGQPGYLACNRRELVLEFHTPGPSSDLAAESGTGRRPYPRPTAALRPAKPVALTQYRKSSPHSGDTARPSRAALGGHDALWLMRLHRGCSWGLKRNRQDLWIGVLRDLLITA